MSSPSPSLASPRKLVIASRQSQLALWQAEHVQQMLQKLYPDATITILGLVTRGDQRLNPPLSGSGSSIISGAGTPKAGEPEESGGEIGEKGNKGLFVKALENALADGRADLAVHSLKDVPTALSPEFTLAAIPERGEPYDAVVSPHYDALDTLPVGSIVGTSSLRRKAMLLARHPHLNVQPLRGNINTRLSQLDAGHYTAIILAAAGLIRIGLKERIRTVLDPNESLPAAGQGALGIEIRADRIDVARWVSPLHHLRTAFAVEAERRISRVLGGSCDTPLAAFAMWKDDVLFLRGSIAMPNGSRLLAAHACASPTTPNAAAALGQLVAEDLLQQGADDILRALSSDG